MAVDQLIGQRIGVVHLANRLDDGARIHADGAALAIVNREPTDQDPEAALVLHEEIGPLLEAIVPAS